MAECHSNTNGYDHQFVDSPPDELLCLICMLVARDPQQLTCCGKVYCKSCVEELREKHSNNCPVCRVDITCFPDRRGERNIKSLKVRCDNHQSDCEWIGDLGAIDKHLTECGYVLLPCPNECIQRYGDSAATPGTSDKVFHTLRKDMEKHVSEECPRRKFQCPHCSKSGVYQEMTTTHLGECNFVKVPCPNEGCEDRIVRLLVQYHRNHICQFELHNCRYANIGCNVRVLRKDLEEHENDSELHLKCAIDKVSELEVKVGELDQSLQNLTIDEKEQKNVLAHLQSVTTSQSNEIFELSSKLECLAETCDPDDEHEALIPLMDARPSQVFKFTNFAERKSSEDPVYSPPFYTSPGGYKICFGVYANGYGKGNGSHVSVFACLMRGENDDHLSWPFIGRVKIELLNQHKDRNHHSVAVYFKEEHDAGKRVMIGDRTNVQAGRGKQCFISHSSLDSYSADSFHHPCQYLKNDCLYFRFKINCTSTKKPWLSSASAF